MFGGMSLDLMTAQSTRAENSSQKFTVECSPYIEVS